MHDPEEHNYPFSIIPSKSCKKCKNHNSFLYKRIKGWNPYGGCDLCLH